MQELTTLLVIFVMPLYAKIIHYMQIMMDLYHDEVEVTNPLGSFKGRHKLGKWHRNDISVPSVYVIFITYGLYLCQKH